MKIIESDIFKNFDDVVFGFSTKSAKDTNDKFSFNMSFSIGDNERRVKENRARFLLALEIEPGALAWQKQIHGDVVKIVTKPGFQGDGDALVTAVKNIALGVFGADCTTIFLYEKKRKVIAAVHSGWRGTVKRILPKTLNLLREKFDAETKNIFAYIAPAISRGNYEVGADVAENFAPEYKAKRNDGKYLLDVSAVNYDYLLRFGVPAENIERSHLCSYENEFLHSYRRDGARSGRALGVIMLR